MTALPHSVTFPQLSTDTTVARAQMSQSGNPPLLAGLDPSLATDLRMTWVLHLAEDHRSVEALRAAEELLYDDDITLPPLYAAWLWLTRMTIVADDHLPIALSSAENALRALVELPGKRRTDVQALLAALLYELAVVHHAMGEDARAAKELTKAQQLLERLAARDSARFAASLLIAVEASTRVIASRSRQLSVLAHYQQVTEHYSTLLEQAEADDARDAMGHLVESLQREGDIEVKMGNHRNAVKYYTKALRYQKKLSKTMGITELRLSIGLARALQRLINRRAAAEQLLNSLRPLAQRLGARAETYEIDELIESANKNSNIMTLLKGQL